MSRSSMQVVILSSAFPGSARDGIDRVHVRRAVALAGHAGVVAVAPTPWAPAGVPGPGGRWVRHARTPARLQLDGIDVHYPRYVQVPGMGPAAGASMALGARRIVESLHRSGRCDVLFAQALLPDGFAAVLLGRRLHAPAVCLGRGSDVHGLAQASAATRALARWTLARLAAVGVVAHALAAPLRRLVPTLEPAVLPNGVDLERFRPGDARAARRALGLADGRIVLFVGRLADGKGLDTLVEAFGDVARREPSARLVLAGDGPRRDDVARRIGALGLAARVDLPGEVTWERVPDWMRAADLVVLPSEGEGMPNVVREALACGRPVVTTPVCDLPRLVGPAVGCLVPPRDAAALATAITTVLARTWDAAALRAHVIDMTWERNAAATTRFLAATLEAA